MFGLRKAMQEEMRYKTQLGSLLTLPPNQKIVGVNWVYKINTHPL